jgi:hypothetical protein
VDFGVGYQGSAWSNPAERKDVNGDNAISAIDALIIINRLNSNIDPTLPDLRPAGQYFVDVNNDGFATALDALIIINHLNAAAFAPGGEGEVAAATTSPATLVGLAPTGSAEGENTVSGPLAPVAKSPLSDAAAYFVLQPYHVAYVAGQNGGQGYAHGEGEAGDTSHNASDDAALSLNLDLQSRAGSLAPLTDEALLPGSGSYVRS